MKRLVLLLALPLFLTACQTTRTAAVAPAGPVEGEEVSNEVSPQTFQEYITAMLSEKGTDPAIAEFYEVLDEDWDTALPAWQPIARQLWREKRYETMAAFCEDLRYTEPPWATLLAICEAEIAAYRADGRFYAVLDLIKWLDWADAPYLAQHAVLERLMMDLARSGRESELLRIRELISSELSYRAGFRELSIVAGIRHQLWTKGPEDAVKAVRNFAPKLSDHYMAAVTGDILSHALRKKQADVAEAFIQFILERKSDRKTLAAVATPYTGLALAANDAVGAITRMQELSAHGAPVDTMQRLFIRHVYTIIQSGENKDLCKAARQYGSLLLNHDPSSSMSPAVARAVFDANILLEDYESAQQLIDMAFPEGNELRGQVLVKIAAHKALKEGNPEEAAKQFRAFMEIVKKEENDSADPVSKELVPKEFILGFNAKRIADILSGVKGKEEAVAAARKEARDYLKAAMEKLDKKAPTFRKRCEDMLKEIDK